MTPFPCPRCGEADHFSQDAGCCRCGWSRGSDRFIVVVLWLFVGIVTTALVTLLVLAVFDPR